MNPDIFINSMHKIQHKCCHQMHCWKISLKLICTWSHEAFDSFILFFCSLVIFFKDRIYPELQLLLGQDRKVVVGRDAQWEQTLARAVCIRDICRERLDQTGDRVGRGKQSWFRLNYSYYWCHVVDLYKPWSGRTLWTPISFSWMISVLFDKVWGVCVQQCVFEFHPLEMCCSPASVCVWVCVSPLSPPSLISAIMPTCVWLSPPLPPTVTLTSFPFCAWLSLLSRPSS